MKQLSIEKIEMNGVNIGQIHHNKTFDKYSYSFYNSIVMKGNYRFRKQAYDALLEEVAKTYCDLQKAIISIDAPRLEKFGISESELNKIDKFKAKIKKKHGHYGLFTYSFTPNGIFDAVKVYSHLEEKEIDVTDDNY